MPRKRCAIPKLGHHKPTNQARVRINGNDVYLGIWGTPEAEEAYRRICAELLASPIPPPKPKLLITGVSVTEVVLAYTKHRAEEKSADLPSNDRLALAALRKLYGRTGAGEFGPLKLRAYRKHLIEKADLCRTEVNRRVNIVKRLFRWAASMELVEGKVWQGLAAVENLKLGHPSVRESEPIVPVSDHVVEVTCRELHPMMRDLIRFVRLTGCRVGEACRMTPGQIDRRGPVWSYLPDAHKTRHRGKERAILIGPRAQEILSPHLVGVAPDEIIFTPEKAMEIRREARRSARKTRVQPSQQGQRKGRGPNRTYYTGKYNHRSVLNAIERACDRAGIPRWHTHQLRHSAATELRAKFSAEHAKAVLGHSTLKMTDRYAALDTEKAAEAMKKIG